MQHSPVRTIQSLIVPTFVSSVAISTAVAQGERDPRATAASADYSAKTTRGVSTTLSDTSIPGRSLMPLVEQP